MSFVEEVFENQVRLPGGQWIHMAEAYMDVVRNLFWDGGQQTILVWREGFEVSQKPTDTPACPLNKALAAFLAGLQVKRP